MGATLGGVMRGVLGHQGGWDEIIVLLSPIPVLAVLRLFERRRRPRARRLSPE